MVVLYFVTGMRDNSCWPTTFCANMLLSFLFITNPIITWMTYQYGKSNIQMLMLCFSTLHPLVIFWLSTLDSMDYCMMHRLWHKLKTKTQDILTYICRFILVVIVDRSANYVKKDITKEKDPKGPYAINTCLNQVTKQANWISTCTEIALTLTEKH